MFTCNHVQTRKRPVTKFPSVIRFLQTRENDLQEKQERTFTRRSLHFATLRS
jgi:hypothetical protein